jgi:hypothetical protein
MLSLGGFAVALQFEMISLSTTLGIESLLDP